MRYWSLTVAHVTKFLQRPRNFCWKALSHRRKVGNAVETVGAFGSTASKAARYFASQANGALDEVKRSSGSNFARSVQ
jgi:hypothetical protein